MSRPARRLPLVAASLALLTLAGCTSGGSDVNPNLLAPKLVLDASVSGTPLVYVHSAFGEHAYDVLEVRVNNLTLRTQEYAYSLEEKLENTSFFLETEARAGESRFRFTGLVTLNLTQSEARVVPLNENGEWENAKTDNLPYERIMDRTGARESA